MIIRPCSVVGSVRDSNCGEVFLPTMFFDAFSYVEKEVSDLHSSSRRQQRILKVIKTAY